MQCHSSVSVAWPSVGNTRDKTNALLRNSNSQIERMVMLTIEPWAMLKPTRTGQKTMADDTHSAGSSIQMKYEIAQFAYKNM